MFVVVAHILCYSVYECTATEVTIGCCISKAGSSSNAFTLTCHCNHLSSFGGNVVVAPNPIDFDKVFMEFARLGESGNIAVLVTICCMFGLYFIVVVFARRADENDKVKVSYEYRLTDRPTDWLADRLTD